MHPCKKKSYADLPDDSLNLVYQRLTSSADHSSFSLVCRRWLHIQNKNHESLWDIDNSTACSLRKSADITPENFSRILCRLLIRFKNLKRLSLSRLPEVTDYVTSQSNLFGSKVQYLCLSFCREYSYKNLSLILSLFRNLESVNLTHSRGYSCRLPITAKGLEVLGKSCSSSLQTVSLGNCQGVTDYGLQVLAKCCSFLKMVDLHNCQRITDEGLESLAKCCASLETVDLGECHWVSDKSLQVLAKCCASLETVSLGHCERITDRGLEVLAKCCASLEKVDLRSCQGITDLGISSLVQNCRKIRSLTIEDCSNVTGLGFLGSPETLTHVYAENVPKLTTEGIKAMVSGGGIQSLHLSGPAVTDEAVIAISIGCPLLRLLWLDSTHEIQLEGIESYWCPKICEQGLRALCYGCNKLSGLFVDNDFAKELFNRERPDVHLI
ncbi:hypothetical protein MKW94_023185 [Papaver nudicaule]|uniref:F-box/LRR-repeat protein 15-like leucin rich repeat domain-containing protein n=1 Tax=Papaver nudicaule TaxID=74823 RepID=A0AA41RZ25_PAPNU|nr:hypothetical protein [Papaver nudicaule]MCL7036391.1 hypothetical protein [Papaver nudicaule]